MGAMTPERLAELKAMPASYYIHRMYAGLQEALQEIARLQAELSAVREDAERWKYVLENHCRAGSPHMNNTWAYHFAGSLRGRWETPEQAVDAAIKELSK